MSLFDQQPMGPVPARRPILLPPDPELEAAVADPTMAEVSLIGPVPRELAAAVPASGGRPRPWPRVAVSLLLVLPMVVPIVLGVVLLFLPDADSYNPPGGVVLGLMLATMVAAHLWWRYRSRR